MIFLVFLIAWVLKFPRKLWYWLFSCHFFIIAFLSYLELILLFNYFFIICSYNFSSTQWQTPWGQKCVLEINHLTWRLCSCGFGLDKELRHINLLCSNNSPWETYGFVAKCLLGIQGLFSQVKETHLCPPKLKKIILIHGHELQEKLGWNLPCIFRTNISNIIPTLPVQQ